MVGRIVNYLFIFLVFLAGCGGYKVESPVYEKYVNEIINAVAKDMNKKHGLICVGSGGSMPNKVYAISLRFHSYRHATIEEARELFVASVQALIDKVNVHEKIRPYLNEYPFTWRGADIVIAFRNKQGNSTRYLDGSVALLGFSKNGNIFYERAELQKRKSPNYIDTVKGTIKIGKVTEDEVFIDLMEEPYEEAVKIVESKRAATVSTSSPRRQ